MRRRPVANSRLLQAMLGCVNELRVYHLNAGAASMVPGFNEAARRSFPEMAADPDREWRFEDAPAGSPDSSL